MHVTCLLLGWSLVACLMPEVVGQPAVTSPGKLSSATRALIKNHMRSILSGGKGYIPILSYLRVRGNSISGGVPSRGVSDVPKETNPRSGLPTGNRRVYQLQNENRPIPGKQTVDNAIPNRIGSGNIPQQPAVLGDNGQDSLSRANPGASQSNTAPNPEGTPAKVVVLDPVDYSPLQPRQRLLETSGNQNREALRQNTNENLPLSVNPYDGTQSRPVTDNTQPPGTGSVQSSQNNYNSADPARDVANILKHSLQNGLYGSSGTYLSRANINTVPANDAQMGGNRIANPIPEISNSNNAQELATFDAGPAIGRTNVNSVVQNPNLNSAAATRTENTQRISSGNLELLGKTNFQIQDTSVSNTVLQHQASVNRVLAQNGVSNSGRGTNVVESQSQVDNVGPVQTNVQNQDIQTNYVNQQESQSIPQAGTNNIPVQQTGTQSRTVQIGDRIVIPKVKPQSATQNAGVSNNRPPMQGQNLDQDFIGSVVQSNTHSNPRLSTGVIDNQGRTGTDGGSWQGQQAISGPLNVPPPQEIGSNGPDQMLSERVTQNIPTQPESTYNGPAQILPGGGGQDIPAQQVGSNYGQTRVLSEGRTQNIPPPQISGSIGQASTFSGPVPQNAPALQGSGMNRQVQTFSGGGAQNAPTPQISASNSQAKSFSGNDAQNVLTPQISRTYGQPQMLPSGGTQNVVWQDNKWNLGAVFKPAPSSGRSTRIGEIQARPASQNRGPQTVNQNIRLQNNAGLLNRLANGQRQIQTGGAIQDVTWTGGIGQRQPGTGAAGQLNWQATAQNVGGRNKVESTLDARSLGQSGDNLAIQNQPWQDNSQNLGTVAPATAATPINRAPRLPAFTPQNSLYLAEITQPPNPNSFRDQGSTFSQAGPSTTAEVRNNRLSNGNRPFPVVDTSRTTVMFVYDYQGGNVNNLPPVIPPAVNPPPPANAPNANAQGSPLRNQNANIPVAWTTPVMNNANNPLPAETFINVQNINNQLPVSTAAPNANFEANQGFNFDSAAVVAQNTGQQYNLDVQWNNANSQGNVDAPVPMGGPASNSSGTAPVVMPVLDNRHTGNLGPINHGFISDISQTTPPGQIIGGPALNSFGPTTPAPIIEQVTLDGIMAPPLLGSDGQVLPVKPLSTPIPDLLYFNETDLGFNISDIIMPNTTEVLNVTTPTPKTTTPYGAMNSPCGPNVGPPYGFITTPAPMLPFFITTPIRYTYPWQNPLHPDYEPPEPSEAPEMELFPGGAAQGGSPGQSRGQPSAPINPAACICSEKPECEGIGVTHGLPYEYQCNVAGGLTCCCEPG